MMDQATIKEKVLEVEGKREFLLKLMEKPNLGTLRIDVNQALEELDELMEEFRSTFPETDSND